MSRWMRALRFLGLLYISFEYSDPSHGIVQAWGQAAPVASFNCQQLQLPITCADLNSLVNQINTVLTPVLPTLTGAANNLTLQKSIAGQPVVISATGTDTNISIGLAPVGNGNIVLFPAQYDTGSTGLLQVANIASWYSAQGIGTCPGSPMTPTGQGNRLAPNGAVQGYLVTLDWLARPRYLVSC